ncbi:glycosyl transferase family 9 [Chitiniphilus shinanonensis]|uniref:Glycosyl transferase family 9 n=1 Tax=Chitiniphilus shinanonensis TaxID=553088 RepID=A0ABQ6C0G9_9NEIS|nr:glycosyltransferase family 9 protein [Chitiniphilus shinanonensis]GLS05992.1 glycosyl transferase family 9 [Chitiniphilus shinanonensis]
MMLWLVTWLCRPLLWLAQRREPAAPRRILLVQTAKIGDMICTLPVIDALARRFPDAALTVMHHPVNRALLKHDPRVTARWEADSSAWRGLGAKLRLARRLRAARYDWIVIASPNLPWLLLPLWAGIPRRIAVTANHGRSVQRAEPLLTDALRHQGERLIVDEWAELLARLDVPVARDKPLYAAPDADAAVDALGLPAGSLIGIGVSAANKLKELGEDKVAALVGELLARSDAHVLLVGGPDDRALAARILGRQPSPRVIDTTGRLALDRLPVLLARLAAYVSVDSGIIYLADALGVPVVSVVGPTDPREQRPLDPRSRFIVERLPCYPCSTVFRTASTCRVGTRACIGNVTATRIADEVITLLHQNRTP